MANPEHLDAAEGGADAIAAWRRAHPGEHLDLREAILMDANFAGADLHDADLRAAVLIGADFTAADLSGADLSGAFLVGSAMWANFTDANLKRIKLPSSEVAKANGSFLNLACCIGLETAEFDSPDFLETYLHECLDYLQQGIVVEAVARPLHLRNAVSRLRALRELTASEEAPPTELVTVARLIPDELMRNLKRDPALLHTLPPRQFEELVAEILASYGWEIHLTPEQKDGGYDLFGISKDLSGVKSSWIIECKRWKGKVGVDVVRALYGLKKDLRGAGNAMLATTSEFTWDANAYKASRYDLELRDYENVIEWINEYQPHRDGKVLVKNQRVILPADDEYKKLS